MRGQGGQINFIYSNAIKGFAATLPSAALAALSRNPSVAYIEQDTAVSLNAVITQTGATWGLDRIDQVALPLNGNYKYDADGTGVTVYIIDTGIRSTHSEFGNRVIPGYTVIAGGTDDCNGHGTHVAGTVGGTTWGVAKKVSLVPVRVLDCSGSGSWSGVIAGIDWVAQKAVKPAVANMSLGGGKSTSVNAAVAGASAAGVTMVVAAGNEKRDACNFSPASEPTAITVGATTSADARSSFSNFGACVDIFAPGSSITSALNTSDTATATWNGTSMASPHVAGVAALVLQVAPTSTPSEITAAILGGATNGKVTSAGNGSPNKLLHSLVSGDGENVGDSGGSGPIVPAAPLLLSASALSRSEISLSWDDKSSNEDGFRIYMGTSQGSLSLLGSVPANSTGVRVTRLRSATTYYFRVTAFNGAGESALSNEIPVKTK
jgi:subtilisin family serine protease